MKQKKSPIQNFNPCNNPLKAAKPEDVINHPALRNFFGHTLYKSSLKLRSLVDQMLENYQLVAAHLALLKIINYQSGEINQLHIGLQTNIDKTTIVKLLDGLEKKGFIERIASVKDRREKLLQVTKKGSSFLQKILPQLKDVEDQFFQPLTLEEKETFINLTNKLVISFFE